METYSVRQCRTNCVQRVYITWPPWASTASKRVVSLCRCWNVNRVLLFQHSNALTENLFRRAIKWRSVGTSSWMSNIYAVMRKLSFEISSTRCKSTQPGIKRANIPLVAQVTVNGFTHCTTTTTSFGINPEIVSQYRHVRVIPEEGEMNVAWDNWNIPWLHSLEPAEHSEDSYMIVDRC